MYKLLSSLRPDVLYAGSYWTRPKWYEFIFDVVQRNGFNDYPEISRLYSAPTLSQVFIYMVRKGSLKKVVKLYSKYDKYS